MSATLQLERRVPGTGAVQRSGGAAGGIRARLPAPLPANQGAPAKFGSWYRYLAADERRVFSCLDERCDVLEVTTCPEVRCQIYADMRRLLALVVR